MLCNIILYLAFFIISLDSEYFRLKSVVCIVLLSIFCFLKRRVCYKIDRKYITPIIIMISFFIFYTTAALIFPDIYLQVPSDQENFVFKVIDRISLIFLFFMMCMALREERYEILLKNVAVIHIFYMISQFFLYYVFGIHLDVLAWFGVEQRSTAFFSGVYIFRPSGFFMEPSTYALNVLILYLPYLFRSARYKKVDYFLPASMILTFSSMAFIMGGAVFALMLLKSGILKNLRNVIIAICIAIPIILVGYKFQQARFAGDNISAEFRKNLISYIWKSRLDDPILLVGGVGIYSYDYYIEKVNDSLDYNSDGRIASIADATFFIYVYMILGVIGIILLILLIKEVDGWYNRLFLMTLFLGKLAVVYPTFFIILYVIIRGVKENKHLDYGNVTK